MQVLFAALAVAAAVQGVAPQAGAKWVPLQSQQVSVQQTPANAVPALVQQAVIIAPVANNVLRAGIEVPLRVEEGLDSNDKGIREGQQFHLTVANNVMLGNAVVIPAGSPATGEITDLRRKGMWGKSGHIVARVLNVRVGDRLIRLSGTFDEHGTTGTAGVVAAIAFVPIAGFFMTGTSAKIPAGVGVRGFLDEDLVVAVSAVAPPVMAAPSAAVGSSAVKLIQEKH